MLKNIGHKPNHHRLLIVSAALSIFAVAVFVVAAWIWPGDARGEAEVKTVYTCPMHPQIVEDEPGTCPICGMDLVAKQIAGNAEVVPPAPLTDGTQDHDHAAESGQTLYTCPMHPQIVREEPGNCPICGMDLVQQKSAPPSDGAKKSAIVIDPVVVQNMGVRVATAQRGQVYRHLRTIGEIEVAEDELSVINLRFSGWIEKIYVDQTGQSVKQGQPLFQIYSPEVAAAQEELLLAFKTYGLDHLTTQAAKRKLELWDIPEWQIKRVLETGDSNLKLTVTAPRSGFVLQKNVVQGARVNAGMDLYSIGNLGRIWVRAEVYEYDAPWVRVGSPATMELSYQQGKVLEGKVGYIYPTLDGRSRTLSVRLEFSNPGLQLRPGSFATVRIETQRLDDVLIVPTEAVLYSGERRVVFVSPEPGRYEPREVVTGSTGDNRVTEILEGLHEGETVVISGQFLLDSESQLQEAMEKFLADKLQNKPAAEHAH